jgi:RNA polymerase sigma factor (sigma-70 family)
MNADSAGYVLRCLRRLSGSDRDRDAPDADLLGRFARHRDEAAFAELLRRHGRLVLGVCRRVVGDAHAAEDAFQATFLLLARRAAHLGRPGSLAGWLHAVAYRLARQARRGDERRRRRERLHARPEATPAEDVSWREVRQLLDAALARLPEHYRAPLVLCYLEGLTQAEAARRLGWSEAVLHGRLERGRQALRRRLARLGLPLAAPLLLPVAADPASAALRAATLATVRTAALGGPVPPAVANLAATGLGSPGVARWKVVTGLLLLAIGLGLGAAGAGRPAVTQPPPASPALPTPNRRADLLGDPLPPDALLRLGTLRHRYLHRYDSRNQPLPGGKVVLTSTNEDEEVRWVDMATGRLTDSWPLPRGWAVCGFSPDGRLALLTDRKTLRLWDLTARKELRTFEGKGGLGSEIYAYFARDGQTVATAMCVNGIPGLIRVWDVDTGRELWHEGKLGSPAGPSVLGFLPDGETLVLIGTWSNRVSLRDRATGRERRSFATMPPNDSRKCALSPAGKTLLMGTAGTAVRAWDVATGKELSPLGGHQGQARSFAFGPDGKTVLTGGGDPFVLVRDWPSGKLRRKIDLGDGRGIDVMAISADGKRAELILWGERALRFFDLGTGKELPPPTEAHRGRVDGVALTPDGKLLVSAGTDDTLRVWDFRSGRHLCAYRTGHPVGASTLALSADGRLVATADFNRGTVALRERDTGRLVRTIDTGGQSVRSVVFAPQGRLLAVDGDNVGLGRGGSRPFLAFWDAESGREVRRLEGARSRTPVFSPDGRLLAGSEFEGDHVRLWEVATGREGPALPQKGVAALAFSPDGRTLACGDGKGITLWELASGKERCRIEGMETYRGPALRFSPDGRWLAVGDGKVILLYDVYDVFGGNKLHSFTGHDRAVTGLVFSPDGRRLASSSSDSTLLVWDLAGVTARRARPRPQADAAAVAAAWTDLASADAKAAFRAVGVLVATPGRSLPLLRQSLRPAAASDVKQIEHWVAELDSDQFAERERATRELARQGDRAEEGLRRFLAGRPSLEARRRAEDLLGRLRGPLTDTERLRRLRAVEVLEHIGTAEARRLLQALSEGASESRLTREAKAALERRKSRKQG